MSPWPSILIALLAALAGCSRDSPATASPPRGQAEKPREVRVAAAAETRVARTVAVTGTLAAEDQIVLSLKVTGRLADLTVDLGSPVRRGQVVARLDPTDFRLRLEQSEAALQQARVRLGLPPQGADDTVKPEQTALVRQARAVLDEARLSRERMARLAEGELIARAQLDTAVAGELVAEGRYQDALEEARNRQAVLAQRRSELELARQQLDDTVLRAPVDGMIRERRASAGEYLAAGAPVATVVRIDPLRLRVAVPERQAADVRPGQTVQLAVEGDPASYGGRVARLSPAIEEQSRTLLIEAEIPNPRGALRPGAFAKAEIIIDAGQQIVVVPASAIVTFAGLDKILTVADGRAVEKRIQLGRRFGENVEVVSGIKAGEAVVVQPGNLVGGQPVTVLAEPAR